VRGPLRALCRSPLRLSLAASVLSGAALAGMAALAATPALGAMNVPTTVSTTLSSNGGASGASITVAPGASVTDTATIMSSPPTIAPPTSGSVTYVVYSDAACSVVVASSGPLPVGAGGLAASSNAVTLSPPANPLGTYYWRAFYSGTAGYQSSASTCGSELETIQNTPGSPPGTPSCATTAAGGTGEITVVWCGPTNPGTAPVQCFQVFRSTGSSPATQIASVCSGSPGFSDPSYTDTSVTCNTTYTYYETSSNMYGTSPPSNTASASAACGLPPPPPGSSPCSSYSGNAAFICALYVDVLRRAPDSAGLNSWLAAIASGTTTTQVALGVITSTESATDYISGLYQGCLGRPVDQGGLSTWLNAFAAGATVEQVDAGVLSSPEFYADAGGTDSGFVNAVYECILGRPVDSAGLATWTSALSNGVSRAQVAYAVDTSNESHVDDVTYFYTALNRSPDPTGLSTWVGALNSGVPYQQVAADIFGSQEFYNDATGA